jgi:hypothetical protein
MAVAWLAWLAWYGVLQFVHEVIHLAIAVTVGYWREAVCYENLLNASFRRHVEIPSACGWRAHAIRHGGWVGR